MTETYDDNGNSLITDADIRENTYSDLDFMKEFIGSKEDPECEEQIITDGVYYSSDNAGAAAEKEIFLVPTSLTGAETNTLCSDFELSDDGRTVDFCPNGCVPTDPKYNEKLVALLKSSLTKIVTDVHTVISVRGKDKRKR